ncbi:MAG: efflux RND transporter periplasmic adaptor subunit [Acidobacteriota bacterium]|jgi:multidrug efflux pump subunit AcrA (membrane-fusion protein)|nr:efflux RND transporter periplasmic adaptor subunit [Acidobacteriota bacterium]
METDDSREPKNPLCRMCVAAAVLIGILVASLAVGEAVYSRMARDGAGAGRRPAKPSPEKPRLPGHPAPPAEGGGGAAGAGKSVKAASHKRRNIVYATGVISGHYESRETSTHPQGHPSSDAPSPPSRLWVTVDVFEGDLVYAGLGKEVKVRAASLPDRVFRGEIVYAEKAIDVDTRSSKVGCAVANDDGALRVGMFVTIEIPM